MHNDTELIKALAQLSAATLGYSTLKKLQEGYCMVESQLVPDYVEPRTPLVTDNNENQWQKY